MNRAVPVMEVWPSGLPTCTANPEGQTSITGTARFVPATFYIASLPFQDTPPNGGYLKRFASRAW